MMMLLGDQVFDDLRRRYAEPHRKACRWDRIGELLRCAEDVVNGIAEPPAFILAILFHKAVFSPRTVDSAARSAALMVGSLGARMPARTLERATALIHAIGEGEIPETDDPSLRGDAALLLDFDHAVLGAEPHRFAAHEAALREEAEHLTEERYRMARAAALRMLLWKDRIFLTDRFYLEREKRARRNIESAMAEYEAA
jgi:predicted metal-dependent HD superfamily phosphohydrolase